VGKFATFSGRPKAESVSASVGLCPLTLTKGFALGSRSAPDPLL